MKKMRFGMRKAEKEVVFGRYTLWMRYVYTIRDGKLLLFSSHDKRWREGLEDECIY